MARIVILGSGVMGTAIAVPAAENGHDVVLVGSPLDDDIIASLKSTARCHPKLGVAMASKVTPVAERDLCADHFHDADVILIGVSSPGIPWVMDKICALAQGPALVVMVTKGLDAPAPDVVRTLPPLIEEKLVEAGLSELAVVGVAGPCIAKELAERQLTAVVFTSREPQAALAAKQLFERPYYRISLSSDHHGVEACAALKNFMAIGVAYARSGFPAKAPTPSRPYDMNPVAAWFQQAVSEMAVLTEIMGGSAQTAYGLAGLGDLFVTVAAGRNSRLGVALGEGMTVGQALSGPLLGETVEGVDTGRVLAGGMLAAVASGELDRSRIPLALALHETLSNERALQVDPSCFWQS